MTDKYRRFEDTDVEIDLGGEDDDVEGEITHAIASTEADINCDIDIREQENNNAEVVTYTKLNNAENNGDTEYNIEIVHIPNLEEDKFKSLDDMKDVRTRLRSVLEHLAFRVVTVLLVLLDVSVVIADLSLNDTCRPLEYVSLVILSYFIVEFALRLYAVGPKEFSKHWIEVADAIVIIVSFIFTILPIALRHLNLDVAFIRLVVAGRLIRIVLIVRLIVEKKNLEKATRQVVSQNKRRYQNDGFDLDLCYITDRVIAMSFPSTGVMAFYRNPIKEVARFLDTKHKGHYKVFNLCSERMYDESLFHNQVARYRVDDHNVPKLEELIDFGRTAREWLEADEENVMAVHCKGGKGRTGTFICTWLVESGTFEEAKESLEFFGDRRTDLSVGSKFQGVETPSQSRYVGYYEKVKRSHDGCPPPEQKLKLKSMCIKAITGVGSGDGRDLTCNVITTNKIWVYDLAKQDNSQTDCDTAKDELYITLQEVPVLTGDTKVMFTCTDKSVPKGYDDCLFYFWFHTSFIEDNRLWLPRDELDNPHKAKTWKVFKEEFGIKLLFES